MPGPADYEGKTSIYDRIRKRNNTDMLVSPRSLRNSHHSFTSLRDRKENSPPKSDRSSSMSHLGPGTYEVDKSLTITEKNKTYVKIGNMKRFSGQYKTISPGP